jgi:hypothetical protein
MENHVDFMVQARKYRDIFFTYYKEHNIYGSWAYFTPQKASEIPRTQEEAVKQSEDWLKNAKPESTFDFSSIASINTANLPQFSYIKKNIGSDLADQLWILTAMLSACIILIWITYRSFIKYDIR